MALALKCVLMRTVSRNSPSIFFVVGPVPNQMACPLKSSLDLRPRAKIHGRSDMTQETQQRTEQLLQAEPMLRILTTWADHVVHNRPGFVKPDGRATIGVRWEQALWKEENGQKVCYLRKPRTRLGVIGPDLSVSENGRVVGRYQPPGVFPEAAAYLYNLVAQVWQQDNELAARLASWAFANSIHRDLKCVLAAFMLVQSRFGEPVVENGKTQFFDADFREVGEAMLLAGGKDNGFNPRMILTVLDILKLPQIAKINHDLGFGRSTRTPARGRYNQAVQTWLRTRERNPRLLQGLVRAGFRGTVKVLACTSKYKPEDARFYDVLRWKQKQASDGRRTLAIGKEVRRAEDWNGKTEAEICGRITSQKMSFKQVVGLLPAEIGLTRAIMMAVIEAGKMSDQDMLIYAPTIEELGLHTIQAVKDRLDKAVQNAQDQRAANIATRVKSKALKEKLEAAADIATEKALEKASRNLRLYWIVDKSGSMSPALDAAKACLTKCLGGFPLDRTHIAVFNNFGKELTLQGQTRAAVENAFRGHTAGGGTIYAEGVRALAHHLPKEDEDAVFLFVGDEDDYNTARLVHVTQQSGIKPVAFGLLRLVGTSGGVGSVVRDAARLLGIPCFQIEERMFDDPYAVTRTLANIIASTPVGKIHQGNLSAPRKSLVDQILETPLLQKPLYARPQRSTDAKEASQ